MLVYLATNILRCLEEIVSSNNNVRSFDDVHKPYFFRFGANILSGRSHGIEREVDDQQMTALHILCANPHVTDDCIRAYLQLAPEAAEQEDPDGMNPFEYLCRNDITFFYDRNFSSVMAWWYGCMPP